MFQTCKGLNIKTRKQNVNRVFDKTESGDKIVAPIVSKCQGQDEPQAFLSKKIRMLNKI